MSCAIDFSLRYSEDKFDSLTSLSISIDRDGTELLSEEFRCIACVEMVEQPLYSSARVLENQYTPLLKCSLDDRYVVAVPTTDGVGIDIRDLQDPEVSYVDAPIEVSPEEIISSTLDLARNYLEHRLDMTPDDITAITRLRVGIEEAQGRLSYYREHGTPVGYESTVQRNHLRTIVTECKHVDRLTEFVQQTDGVEGFVRDLETASDEDAREWYDELLSYADPEIPSEAAKALAENPDPRAKDALLQTRWKFQAEVVPHAFRALAKLGGEDVKTALLDYIDVADKAPIRKATVETLGSFEGETVRETLRDVAADESEGEEIRRVARESLAGLEE